jgi:hypothetical protein
MFVMKKRKSPYMSRYPERSKDVFVTQAMLYAVRDELKSDINGLRREMRSEIRTETSKLGTEIRAEVSKLGSEVSKLGVEVSKLSSNMYRLTALVEEQNARNIAVMDGLTNLFSRQERIEARVDQVEKSIADFQKP